MNTLPARTLDSVGHPGREASFERPGSDGVPDQGRLLGGNSATLGEAGGASADVTHAPRLDQLRSERPSVDGSKNGYIAWMAGGLPSRGGVRESQIGFVPVLFRTHGTRGQS